MYIIDSPLDVPYPTITVEELSAYIAELERLDQTEEVVEELARARAYLSTRVGA
jgi:hypothetical protein